MTAIVPAVPVDDLFVSRQPGEFKFWRLGDRESGRPDGLHFVCPCGCGSVLGVSFEPGAWTWDGNEDAPTVTPSIRHLDGCHWHGFLTAGEFLPA